MSYDQKDLPQIFLADARRKIVSAMLNQGKGFNLEQDYMVP